MEAQYIAQGYPSQEDYLKNKEYYHSVNYFGIPGAPPIEATPAPPVESAPPEGKEGKKKRVYTLG